MKFRYSPSSWKQAVPKNSIWISILVIFSFSINCRQGLHELYTCAIRCKFWLPDSYYLACKIGILRPLPGGTWPNTLHHNVGLGMQPNVQMRAAEGPRARKGKADARAWSCWGVAGAYRSKQRLDLRLCRSAWVQSRPPPTPNRHHG